MTTQHFDAQIWSDLHKDAYGFRPRFSLAHYSDADLDALWLRTIDDLAENMAAEREAALVAQRDFEARIDQTIELGARDRAQAIRWIADAVDAVEADHVNVSLLMWEVGVCDSLAEMYATEMEARA